LYLLDFLKNTTEVLTASARHKGASVTEVLVNCVIFNDGIHKGIVDKAYRADRTIFLRHGEKMVYGANMDKGLVLDGLKLKSVTIGQDGYTMMTYWYTTPMRRITPCI